MKDDHPAFAFAPCISNEGLKSRPVFGRHHNRFKNDGATRSREDSRFRIEDGLWIYADGSVVTTPSSKTVCNDPCPCGSSKDIQVLLRRLTVAPRIAVNDGY